MDDNEKYKDIVKNSKFTSSWFFVVQSIARMYTGVMFAILS